MRILVVEDEHQIACSLKAGLEEADHVVDLAHDGESGFTAFLEHTYDVMILDWMLPKRDGLELCRCVRRTDGQIPILMLTVRNEIADRVAGLRNGADDYLVKPFSFFELLARVDALGRRRRSGGSPGPSASGLRLDPDNCSVWYGEQIITLSRREYSLLYYLLYHRGRTISRDELVVRAWELPIDHYGSGNLLDFHIRELKRKLGRGASNLITAVRGLGYCLNDDQNHGIHS